MAYYCISFRIADQTANGKSYDDRRSSLIAAARAQDSGFWDSTTSFILAESSLDTWTFAKSVCADLSEQHDMAVVFDPSDMSMSYFGQVNAPEVLESFFRIPKKL
ncbi:hypothetical protein NOJ05_18325 [Neorhizobium galegae]|uniref:hypothetical protein n=1 Tax=Neorhizobium galegae TaxID=399 RepID=UPI0021047D05|nr:hypothetical protein [Neorhizobium galegae]MCQ1779164.1 hypothetical protein [Neorhizobium galegae]MCQ1799461.1 hypothetical protein [Neorhizobium galegae]